MLSDNFDTEIKESLDQHPSAFEESSWQKMEILLDKHLPQKKDDRRKMLFLLFFFLLLGGGATLLFTGNAVEKKHEVISQQKPVSNNKPDNEKAHLNNDLSDRNITTDVKNVITHLLPENKNTSQDNKIFQRKSSIANKNNLLASVVPENKLSNIQKEPKQKKSSVEKTPDVNENTLITNGKTTRKQGTDTEKNLIPVQNKTVGINQPITKQEKKISPEINKLTETAALVPENTLQVEKSKPVKSQTTFLKNIFFTLSAGPDISSVGLDKAGKIKFSSGAGLGYIISNRLAFRIGFYKGRKIYTAGPEEYNPPASFWNYYPSLKTIDADCRVYEVPLMIDYNFSKSKKQNWFVSAGVSSLFMKKEVYEYYFKPSNSTQYINYTRTYKNQNKHYFSILDLSGGYARKISSSLSLQAEPYLKIAMTGVGYGKVKLNSSGILFSAIIRPFQPNGKK